MQKFPIPGFSYDLPSGNSYHPSRCIIKDGCLTWSDALHSKIDNDVYLPTELAHEQHIIKTAQRLEELNSWLVQPDFELHHCICPYNWFNLSDNELAEGISLYFNHRIYSIDFTYEKLTPHIKPHEDLEVRGEYLFYKRC